MVPRLVYGEIVLVKRDPTAAERREQHPGQHSTSVSESLTQVLRWVYWWNSTVETPKAITESQALVELNTDFSIKGRISDDYARS